MDIIKWENEYKNLRYIKDIEHEFEYNKQNDLILAKSIQGKFVDMPGSLEDLPNDGLNGKIEEFKYEYNSKGQKIKVFGKKDSALNFCFRQNTIDKPHFPNILNLCC